MGESGPSVGWNRFSTQGYNICTRERWRPSLRTIQVRLKERIWKRITQRRTRMITLPRWGTRLIALPRRRTQAQTAIRDWSKIEPRENRTRGCWIVSNHRSKRLFTMNRFPIKMRAEIQSGRDSITGKTIGVPKMKERPKRLASNWWSEQNERRRRSSEVTIVSARREEPECHPCGPIAPTVQDFLARSLAPLRWLCKFPIAFFSVSTPCWFTWKGLVFFKFFPLQTKIKTEVIFAFQCVCNSCLK